MMIDDLVKEALLQKYCAMRLMRAISWLDHCHGTHVHSALVVSFRNDGLLDARGMITPLGSVIYANVVEIQGGIFKAYPPIFSGALGDVLSKLDIQKLSHFGSVQAHSLRPVHLGIIKSLALSPCQARGYLTETFGESAINELLSGDFIRGGPRKYSMTMLSMKGEAFMALICSEFAPADIQVNVVVNKS